MYALKDIEAQFYDKKELVITFSGEKKEQFLEGVSLARERLEIYREQLVLPRDIRVSVFKLHD